MTASAGTSLADRVRRRRVGDPLLCAAIFAFALVLRLIHLRSAYDVYLDEATYSRISAGAAIDWRLMFARHFFYLHGPLSFYVQALLIRAFNIHGTAISVIWSLRTFNVIFGALIAALLYVIVKSIASRRWGLVAAMLFSCDPFVISYDSRLFLETFTTMWIVSAFAVLLPLTEPGERSERELRARAVIGGVLLGCALLSKEESAPLYAAPLLWCLIRSKPLTRRTALTTSVTAVLTYLPYPIIAVSTGGGSQFAYQKFNGIERLLGIVQSTGFNKAGAPSLVSRLTANLDTFLATYAIIGLGVLGGIYLLRHGNPRERLVALWGAGGIVMLAFQVAHGTLEEQMFYYLVVPDIVVVAAACAALSRRDRWRRAFVVSMRAGVAVFLCFDLAVWVLVHTRSDQAMVRTVGWMEHNVPSGTRIAPLADGIQLLLPRYALVVDPEAGSVTPRELIDRRAQVIVTSSVQVDQGYSAATPALVSWLKAHAVRRYSATGATDGTVIVWQLSRNLPHAAPPGPEALRPRAPLSAGEPDYQG